MPVVFAEGFVIFGVHFGVLAGAEADEAVGLFIAQEAVVEDEGDRGRV